MEEMLEGLSSPSAIESDAVWERFRRSDNEDIISRLVSPDDFLSKKDLYHPTLMDEGTLSFALEKSSGKRFSEVVELVNVRRLEIKGKMETRLLSMNTTYAAYLVYKFKLNPEGSLSRRWLQQVYRRKQRERKLLKEREDGWLEIEMGEFFNDNDGREDREVYIDLEGTKEINHKSGLIIQGIELRPKETSAIVDSNRDHGESDGTEAEERNKVDFFMPKGCFSNTLSLKTSRYARRQQASSSTFRWTLESDAVWETIMPPDYKDILSRSGSRHLIAHSSKKDIYNYLCSNLILMDEGKMSVALDKWSAKKTYMFGARQLLITWGNDSRYWMWQSLQESRFSEVAKVSGAWLEFYGKMETRELSPKTTYVAYVVYKFTKKTEGLVFQPLEVYLRFMGGAGEGSHTAYLDPDGSLRNDHRKTQEERDQGKDEAEDQQNRKLKRDVKKWMQWERGLPRERGDGWMEIEMGEFFNDQGEDGDVDMGLHGMEGSYWKSGLVIEGIELRPKEFSEGAQLSGAWLEIHGMMDTGMLSQKTTYAAYFVFKFEESNRTHDTDQHLEVYLRFVGGAGEGIRTMCLDPDDKMRRAHRELQEKDVQIWLQGEREFPRVREDGWKEIEMGEFFNDQGKDGVVDMGLKGDKGLYWKSGLIIQGIELRPKEFTEVAQLLRVCHKIYGKMETRILSPKTTYAAYLVFKFAERTSNNDRKALVVYLKSDEDSDEKSHNVHLDPDRSLRKGHPSEERDVDRWLQREKDLQRERGNGWLEIEMGEFFNDNEDDRKVEMGLKGMEGLNWNSDLIIEGIELRPKEFSEVAVLVDVCWLEIHGYIKTQRLSPKTIYAAYLVFKFTERTHGLDCTVKVSVKVRGVEVLGSSSVCLDPDGILRKELKEDDLLKRKKELPFERKDGWIEIWMGDFPNYQREDWEMDMSLMEVDARHWKSGLIIQGIELRPTEFSEVAVLLHVCWLEIHGCITTQILSPNTTYEAYLVFKFAEENYGLDSLPVKLCVKVREDEVAGSALTEAFRFQKEGSRSIYLDPDGSLRKELQYSNLNGDDLLKRKKELPLEREDEWIEIWMGDFDNDQGEDREVVMHLLGEEGTSWKSGLVVQGIEIPSKREINYKRFQPVILWALASFQEEELKMMALT
ncbi:hypothetical protein HHK36_022357 [Tetracentron sinense]|uniref:Uncharacterized protein n=1 Tax=Tetracentron sinense TaxID=13715 RepID=A0A834YUJ6_TETSI|nr:hypothetical protein HHK36_022357 [Tetracentron sinense]